MKSQIISSAEPFFFPGGDIGCLLVHGFTGSPKEMRGMGEFLHQQGYSVLGIRLAGHATQPDDLRRARWSDWLLSTEEGWYLLRGAARQIFVCGLSMGGVLSLMMAARFPVSGVIAMSTPYQLPADPRLRFIRYLQYLQPKVSKGEADWQDPEVAHDHVDYPYYPTRAIIETQALLAVFRQSLPLIAAPVMLIHSYDDQVVAPDNMEKLFAALGSQQKERLWIENSGHAITCDQQHNQVFIAADQFIGRVATQVSEAT